MFACFKFSAYIRYFFNVLIEMNVNISNELNFLMFVGSFILHATQCILHFDKSQKNEIHSLNNLSFIYLTLFLKISKNAE